jgi:ABC-2 type transport system ATP-binding protein
VTAAAVWTRITAEAGLAVGLLLAVDVWVPSPLVPAGAAATAGAFLGFALVVLLARTVRLPVRVGRGRVPLVVAKAVVLAIGSASEEVVWRWFAIGVLAPQVGVATAFGLSTLVFALLHLAPRAMLVHAVTGGAFGGAYLLTGSLAACICAHVSYNLLILVASEAGRALSPARVGAGGPPLCLRGVEKRFGEVAALRGISLTVSPGEVLALLGPNGAGKTTAIRIMLGLRRPDAGEARLFGRDPRDPRSREQVGATPQDTGFPLTLRVREVVEFAAAHFPPQARVTDLLDRFDLAALARRQVGGLSGGERRRLSVALAFAGKPAAVFLDEPTAGLDPRSRHGVWDHLRAFAAAGGTIVLTTHHLDEAEALASRVIVITRGQIVTEGTVPEIREAVTATLARADERRGSLTQSPVSLEEAYLELTQDEP